MPNPSTSGQSFNINIGYAYYPYPNNNINSYTASCTIYGGNVNGRSFSSVGATGQYGWFEQISATITDTIAIATTYSLICSDPENGQSSRTLNQAVSAPNSLVTAAIYSGPTASPSSPSLNQTVSITTDAEAESNYSVSTTITVTPPSGPVQTVYSCSKGVDVNHNFVTCYASSASFAPSVAGTHTVTVSAWAKSATGQIQEDTKSTTFTACCTAGATITVTTNSSQAQFTVNNYEQSFSGTGTSFTKSFIHGGTFTVTDNGNGTACSNGYTVSFTPSSSLVVNDGQTGTFTLTYTCNPSTPTPTPSATPSTPSAPTASLICTGANSDPDLRVSWGAVSGADSYDLYRNGVYRGNYAVTSVVDFPWSPGTSYYFQVAARNSAGVSGASGAGNSVVPQSGQCNATINVIEQGATNGNWIMGPDSNPSGKAFTYTVHPAGGGTAYTLNVNPPTGYDVSSVTNNGSTMTPGQTKTYTIIYSSNNPTCTMTVGSTYNGAGVLPPGGYNYSISSGGTTLTGSNGSVFSVPPGSTWTIVYTGGSTATFGGYTPSQSQSCPSGGAITFTLNFNDGPPGNPSGPGGVGSPLDQNTGTNAAIPCGQVWLSWGAGSRATSYNLFKSTDPSTPGPVWVTTAALTYNDTPSPGVTTYYWVQSQNAYGNSTPPTPFSPFGIQGTPCSADFSTSNQVVTNVNGQSYSYTSSCAITSQNGIVKTIKKGDRVTLSVDICNNGNMDANNVSVSIDLTNTNLSWNNPPNVTMTGGSARNYSINGNVGIFTFGTIQKGFNARIVYDAAVTGGSSSQKLLRFFSNANMSFTTALGSNNAGCRSTGTDAAHPCTLGTGYVVYYTGNRTPTQTEVNP